VIQILYFVRHIIEQTGRHSSSSYATTLIVAGYRIAAQVTYEIP